MLPVDQEYVAPRRRSRVVIFRHITQKPTKIETHDLLAAHRRVRCLSARGAGQVGGVFKDRYDGGLSTVNSVGSSVVRALITRLNKSLEANFASVPCPQFSKSDGSAVVCTDLGELVRKAVWIAGKPFGSVKLIRLNCDGGTGDEVRLWISWSYNDDPRFFGEAPKSHGQLDTGVNRVYCITAVPHAKESPELVRWIFNSQNISNLWRYFPNAEIVLPNDMKMQILTCGLQGASSRFSSIYTLFSQWPKHSLPLEERTAITILSDNCERQQEEKRSGTIFFQFCFYQWKTW